MKHRVTLLLSTFETHDVKRFVFSRPEGFEFSPGQAIELALDRDGWRRDGHPFTMTSLPDAPVLEFTIKEYPEHDGLTTRLHRHQPGDTVLLSDPFDTYSDRGPGIFLAGGAGITPFLAILRDLHRRDELDGRHLFFSNKSPRDVICEKELRQLLGDRLVLTCTEESAPGYDDRLIDRAFLEDRIEDFDRRFYVCGPPGMVKDLQATLDRLGASSEHIVV